MHDPLERGFLLKFADVTLTVGLLKGGNENAYTGHSQIQSVVNYCNSNFLCFLDSKNAN